MTDKKYPDWNNKECVEEALKKMKESNTLHGLITAKPIDIITYTKEFVECRSCGKTAGYIVLPQTLEQVGEELDFDFECMACYEEENK